MEPLLSVRITLLSVCSTDSLSRAFFLRSRGRIDLKLILNIQVRYGPFKRKKQIKFLIGVEIKVIQIQLFIPEIIESTAFVFSQTWSGCATKTLLLRSR